MREVALELNISHHTAKNWMKRGHPDGAATSAGKEKRPPDWSAQEQLQTLNETHGFSSETRQAQRRGRRVFAHHLTSWKTAFCAPTKALANTGRWRSFKDENEQFKRELLRKEKAWLKAAALRMLQENFRAPWQNKVKWNDQPSAAPPGHHAGGPGGCQAARHQGCTCVVIFQAAETPARVHRPCIRDCAGRAPPSKRHSGRDSALPSKHANVLKRPRQPISRTGAAPRANGSPCAWSALIRTKNTTQRRTTRSSKKPLEFKTHRRPLALHSVVR